MSEQDGMAYLENNDFQEPNPNNEASKTEEKPIEVTETQDDSDLQEPQFEHSIGEGTYSNYYKVKRSDLAYGGVFYPEHMEIYYRGAGTPEIRHWSTMDSDNEFDIMDHFTTLLKSCLNVKGGSWKDILEVDRYRLVLLIQDVTFTEQENPVYLSTSCHSCNNQHRVRFSPYHIDVESIDQKYFDKYLNREKGKMILQTKSYGNIDYRPATLGVTSVIYNFLKSQKPAYVKKYSSFIRILPRLIPDWRKLREKDIKERIERWNSWDSGKIAFIDKISQNINFQHKSTTTVTCNNKLCGIELDLKVSPEGDIRDMFLRTNIVDDELI